MELNADVIGSPGAYHTHVKDTIQQTTELIHNVGDIVSVGAKTYSSYFRSHCTKNISFGIKKTGFSSPFTSTFTKSLVVSLTTIP